MRPRAHTQSIHPEPVGNLAEPCAADVGEECANYLFQLSRDVILCLDRAGNILCINQRGVQLSGYSETELRGANLSERLLLPEDRPAISQVLHDLSQGKAREYDVRWRTKDGTVIHFDGVSVPHLSESGEFLSTLCTLRDVTERKSTEEKLRKSEEKYRDLIEISPDAVYVVDANGVCVLGNRAGAELFGIPQEQLVGTPVTDTYLPEERHLFLERLEKLRTGGTLRFERKFVRKNGEIVPVEVSVTGVRGGYFQAILRDISKRKHAEKALRESEERYRVLVEFSPNSICVHRDGKVLYMNEAGVRLFGAKDLTQVIGRSVLDFIHPDSLPVVRERMRQIQAGETAPLIEEKFVTLNGEVRDVEVTAIPIIWEHAPAAQVMIRDITERKHAEEAVRRSEKELRDLIETMPAMTFVTRPDGSNEFVSRPWIEYSGLSAEQTEGSGWEATLHPDDAKQHHAKWHASLSTGQPFENEARHRDAHGNYRWLLVRAVPLRDEQGNILKWYGTAIDVEDRKRAEEDLRRSEAYLAEAQKLSQTGSWAWSYAADTATYWSEENFRIWGLDPQQGLPDQATVVERIHPDDRESVVEATRKAMREKSDHVAYFRIVLPDGTVKHLESIGHPVFGMTGEMLDLVGTHVDVTERKRAEALLAGEKRLLEMIATGVPLAEILNALCLIIEEQRSGTLASVLLQNPDGVHLNVVAAPNLPNEWIEQMEKLPIGPCAGSCGTAAFRGSPVIVSDIATDPLWDVPQHRAAALQHGLRASWSNPVVSPNGKVLGTFCIYHREPRRPNTLDFELIELATHIARVAIERDRAEEALRRSESFLAEGQRISHTGSWSWDVASGNVTWSEEHYRIFGVDPDEIEPTYQTFLQTVHPEDRARIDRDLAQTVGAKRDFDMEFRIALADGTIKYVQGVGRPVLTPAGQVSSYIGTTVDITARKRAEMLLAGEKRLLEMVARGDSLPRILDALCRLVEKLATDALSSILLLEPNGNRLRHGAAPNLPQAYIDAVDGTVIGPSVGSCGTAAYRGKTVIVSDIASDPLWADGRRIALPHGLRACWSTPILSSEGKVLGTFATYYREPRNPTPQQLEIMEQVTHLASIALERKRAEEALRASEQVARGQVEALAQSLDVLATAPEPEKFIGQMLSTIGRLLNARSVSLWLFDESTDSLVWRLMADGGKLTEPDPEHPFMKDPLFWKQNHVIQELLFTAGPVVCEDVETDPRVTGEWRDYLKRKGAKRFLAVPILVGGQVRGFVGVRHSDRASYRPEEIELTQALAHQVMLAIQLNEFADQSRRAAVFEERNRMARDIHDTLAQGFTGVIVQLEAAEDAVSCGCRKEADDHLHRAGELARRSLSEARRSVHALRPQALQEHNFWDALKGIIKNTTVGTALRTKFEVQGKLPELPRPWQENLLRIGQEALTNTLKYAHAVNFETRLSYKARQLRLELRDDGDGFKVKDRHDGVGLAGMRERVAQMGGELKITSARGKGTKITVVLLCNGESMS